MNIKKERRNLIRIGYNQRKIFQIENSPAAFLGDRKGNKQRMLKRLVSSSKPVKPILPLAHMTKWENFSQIIISNDKKLIAHGDPNDSKNLYFFYGVPYYKLSSHRPGGSNILLDDRPVGLLFKSHITSSAKCIYPFDSGGFEKRFKKYFPENYSLAHFEIPVTNGGTEPAQLVSLLYGSNDKYIFGEPKNKEDITTNIEEYLIDFFNADFADFDERNHAIEIHFENNIMLEGNVELLILPKNIFEQRAKRFAKNITAFQIETYEDQKRKNIQDDAAIIRAKATEYLRRGKYLDL